MEIIGDNNAAIISYNNTTAKTNEMSILMADKTGADYVKLNLEASTAGDDGEGNKVFGKGEYVTYTINVANFNQ